jgi:acetyl/propionyl-CoA carboxylase alpha subunit
MFNKILIANRGDCTRSVAAAQPFCRACAAAAGDLDTETAHV